MKRVLTVGLLAVAAAGCTESPVDPPPPNLGVVDVPALAVGQTYSVPAGAEGIRIAGGAAGGEFTLIPFAASGTASANFLVQVTASGIGTAVGPPNPSLVGQRAGGLATTGLAVPDMPTATSGFKGRLREVENRDLTPLLRDRTGGDGAMLRSQSAVASSVPAPGDLMQFNVRSDSACATPDRRTGRVVAVSQRTIVVADTANPRGAGTFTDDEYRSFGTAFDQSIWPVSIENFGEPRDVDSNQRVIIFFTRAVNELTPRNQTTFVGGFFFARDLFPRTAQSGFSACAGSNHAEMFYMLVPDPLGTINGNRRTKESELAGTVRTLAHEFQHLINASRRLYVAQLRGANWNEQAWLNEGLSHIAEELMAFSTSSLAPRQNIDAERLRNTQAERAAFNSYVATNVQNFARYLENPDTLSLMWISPSMPNDVGLSTRGAAWHFLRYAADRRVGAAGSESTFWRGLVDSNTSGLENLRTVLGGDPLTWIQDWLVAVYADDALGGLDARFTQPTWNLRSIYPTLVNSANQPVYGRYPLRTRSLAAGNTESLRIRAGSAAYLRFAVGDSGPAEVLLRGGGGAALDRDVKFTLVRTR